MAKQESIVVRLMRGGTSHALGDLIDSQDKKRRFKRYQENKVSGRDGKVMGDNDQRLPGSESGFFRRRG